MIRPSYLFVLIAAFSGYFSTVVVGQVGIPPRQGQTPAAGRQQTPRNIPPGPTAEDILKLLFPPDTQPDEIVRNPEYWPRPSAAVVMSPYRLQVPSAEDVMQMTTHEQRAMLRKSLARLDEELDGLSTGASWKTFLQTGALGSALWCQSESDPEPNAITRDLLKSIAERFDQVNAQPKYATISKLLGFKAAHAVLPEYATGKIEKGQRSLRREIASLVSSLSQIQTGPGWKQHLRVDDIERLASQSEELGPADTDILRAIAERFSEVERNPKYQGIAATVGFASSRVAMQQLAESVKKQEESQSGKKELATTASSTREGASNLERIVASLIADFQDLKKTCAEEARAGQKAALAKKDLAAAAAGDKMELAKKSQQAEDILRQIKERHDESVRANEEKLQKVLKVIQAGMTKQLEGKSVLLLPLDSSSAENSTVELLPLEAEKSKTPLKSVPPEDAPQEPTKSSPQKSKAESDDSE